MRIAYQVDIMLFHQLNIQFHQFLTYGTSQLGMFVTVSPLYQYRHTVDTKTPVLDFRSTETDFTTGQFGYFPLCVFQLKHQCVQIRIFGTPRFYIRNLLLFKCYKITQSTGFDIDNILQNGFAEGILQCISNRACRRRRTFYRHFKSEKSVFVRFLIQRGIQFVVGDILFWGTVKIYIPLDTAQTPHILTFQISTRTPTVDFQSYYVLSFGQYLCNIPFSRSFRTLIISEQFTVHPYIIKRDYPLAAKYYPTSFPIGRHFESTAIRTDFILGMRH